MKNFLLAAFACVIIAACNKSASSTLTGRWKVVSDSSITESALAFYNVYNGNDDDYFNFASNGLLYIKEGSNYDTMSYNYKDANTISLVQFGLYINAAPETGNYKITGNNARIFVTPDLLNPGLSYQRIINLKK